MAALHSFAIPPLFLIDIGRGKPVLAGLEKIVCLLTLK